MSEDKVYLGDGAFLERTYQGVILTAENGLEVTDRVVLEPEVLRAMLVYLKQWGIDQ